MSHWNYRVVRKAYPPGLDGTVEHVLGIHEAYCDDEGRVSAITDDRMEPHGETLDELRQDLAWMAAALDKPVLDFDKIPEDGAVPLGVTPKNDGGAG